MDYQVVIDRNRNRIYFTPPAGISVPSERHDGTRRWWGMTSAPSRDKAGIIKYLDGIVAAKAAQDAAAGAYAVVKGEIPADYRRRHGALYGGTVDIGDGPEEIHAPAFGELRMANWQQIAQHMMRATGGPGSLIAGRVQNCDTLYCTTLVDGRVVYREVTERGFSDDMRESYWFPLDLFGAVCRAEIKARGITVENAKEWLTQYRGCVDTELYEFAARSLSDASSASRQISALASVPGLVTGQSGDVTPRLTKSSIAQDLVSADTES